jgi:hypothetical protein
MTIKLLESESISDTTTRQDQTIDKLSDGLDYPVQGRGYRAGRHILPIWTDGDGFFYAVARDGKLLPIPV